MKTKQEPFVSLSKVLMPAWPWPLLAPVLLACVVASSVAGQTAPEEHRAAAHAAPGTEPSAKIFVDPPIAEALSLGTAVVHFRTGNLRIAPAFGPAALAISPRVGHIHVSVDDAQWVWAHASGEPVIVTGLAPGSHQIRLQLVTANHQRLDEAAVKFTVPRSRPTVSSALDIERHHGGTAVQPAMEKSTATLIIDSPLPEPLSRGVVFVRYRTGHLNNVPMSGSSRAGRILVRVDEASWSWADASGNPVIVQGLAPGRHNIFIEFANSADQVIDKGTVEVTIPAVNAQTDADRERSPRDELVGDGAKKEIDNECGQTQPGSSRRR